MPHVFQQKHCCKTSKPERGIEMFFSYKIGYDIQYFLTIILMKLVITLIALFFLSINAPVLAQSETD
jgi:hypothetical protein